MGDGFGAKFRHGADERWFDRRCLRRQHGEGKRAEDVGGEHDGPEPEGVPELAFFFQYEGDGVEGVLSEELRAANDDSDKS